jgi:translation initiation factor IF-2
MRVYALAKQLGMENRDLIPELKRMGITVASHSSVLDDDVVQKVLEKLGPKSKSSATATGKTTEADAGSGERSKAGIGSGHAVPRADRLRRPRRLRSLPSPTSAAF